MSSPPRHPLFDSFNGIEDTLSKCAATLYCLADLFGGNADQYPVLDNDQSRYGMWLQLHGVADCLEAIQQHLEAQRRQPNPDPAA